MPFHRGWRGQALLERGQRFSPGAFMNFNFPWRSLFSKMKMLLAAGLIVLLGWVSAPSMAQAAAFDGDQVEYLATVFEKMDNKAKSDLDTVAGSGSSNQLEGKVDRATGVIQENLGDARDDLGQQIEGAANRAKANVKETAGIAAKAIDNATDDLENASESLVEKVKNFFD